MIRIEIKTDNAAFDGEVGYDGHQEVSRILAVLGAMIVNLRPNLSASNLFTDLRDINGNKVGFCEIINERHT